MLKRVMTAAALILPGFALAYPQPELLTIKTAALAMKDDSNLRLSDLADVTSVKVETVEGGTIKVSITYIPESGYEDCTVAQWFLQSDGTPTGEDMRICGLEVK